MEIKPNKALEILEDGTPGQIKALFEFDRDTDPEVVRLKYLYWTRYFFPKMFKSKNAPFHTDMEMRRIRLYRGLDREFLNIAFRGSAKTTHAKSFRAFAISNDTDHYRKYLRVLSKDLDNAKQSVTDIYNMLISSRRSPIGKANLSMRMLYPEIFAKTEAKREETMSSFTTSTGVKMIANSILPDQRGNVQGDEESSRPDFDWYDDFETRATLSSAIMTHKIWLNMQEAKDGLSKDGGSEYTCNYISEQGNVHKLVERIDNKIIIPIEEPKGAPTWSQRYTNEEIRQIEKSSDDFEGEYLCKPNASKDIYFDREILDKMDIKEPIREIAGFKMYKQYDPSHRYAGGHDVAGGVGLDSSTSCFIDFSTVPAQVVATFASNTIQPEAFGDEIYSEANYFGNCIVAPENNKFDQTILKAKQLGARIYKSPKGKTAKTLSMSKPTFMWGWETNSLTKSNMMADARKAVNDGLVELNDKDLINEAKSYTRNDLIDKEPDARLITRHFDLLTAFAIAWQMKDVAESKVVERDTFFEQSQEPEVNPAL